MNTEQAFRELQKTEEGEKIVYECYYEDDVVHACKRFNSSEEWEDVKRILNKYKLRPGSMALDVGAGNGIGSYSLGKLGFQVISIEPDPSNFIGNKAIKNIVQKTSLPISILSGYGEFVPLGDAIFDIVYLRQVLHHAIDLQKFINEISRVLKPDGIFIASREHVVDNDSSLRIFLDRHPIHRLANNENAFSLVQYLSAIKAAGMQTISILGCWDSAINYYPRPRLFLDIEIQKRFSRKLGKIGGQLAKNKLIGKYYWQRESRLEKTPGRFFTFIARKK